MAASPRRWSAGRDPGIPVWPAVGEDGVPGRARVGAVPRLDLAHPRGVGEQLAEHEDVDGSCGRGDVLQQGIQPLSAPVLVKVRHRIYRPAYRPGSWGSCPALWARVIWALPHPSFWRASIRFM